MGLNQTRHFKSWTRFFSVLLFLTVLYQNCGPSFKAHNFASEDYASAMIANGQALFAAKCMSCHGDISTTTKRDATAAQITNALSNIPQMLSLKTQVSPNDILAIEAALSTKGTQLTCDPKVVGRVGIHQLNNYEYNNVMRDLTGIDSKPAAALPKDPYTGFFSNMAATLATDQTRAQIYFDLAIKVLDGAFSQAYGNIVTCNPATMGARPCAEKVIGEFGLKAFRRPLTATEQTNFVNLFNNLYGNFPAGTAGSAFDESLKGALQAILISPQFIYRIIEMPANVTPGYVKTLNAYELATRLSFFLWGSIPDATLFGHAATGRILDQSVLLSEVDRMLKDPKSAHLTTAFGSQWLKIEGLSNSKPDPTIYPQFNESIRQAMLTESRLLLSDIFQRDGSPYLILNADYTYLNTELGAYYQIPGAATSQFVKVSTANTPRVGMLTHGSILTVNSKSTESSIVQRGLWALNRLLCTTVANPPNGAVNMLPPETPLTNPRRTLESHSSNASCAGCHSQIDPVGIGLENFDGVGRHRTHYRNGDIVDSSGQFTNGGSFSNAREMSRILVQSEQFRQCYAQTLMSYSMGRLLEASDKCYANTMARVAVTPSTKFSEMVKAIVTSEQFLKQKGAY